MNQKVIWPILFAVACLPGMDSIGQPRNNESIPDQYRAVHWSLKDGLQGDVYPILIKDSQGFLWIGTQFGGLSRFDGVRFQTIIPGNAVRGAINSDDVLAFAEDSLHNIWIGTKKGLSRYDMLADTFSNFHPDINAGYRGSPIIPFWCSPLELYCFEPGIGIVAYDIHSFKKRKLMNITFSQNLDWLRNAVFDRSSNSVWMSGEGLGFSEKAAIFQISLADAKIVMHKWNCSWNFPGHQHMASMCRYDPVRKSIWINSNDGLLEFSPGEKRFNRIDNFDKYVRSRDYYATSIDLDQFGRVWLTSAQNGIFIYDPKTGRDRPLYTDTALQKITRESNKQTYCDREGIVWCSDLAGIYQYLPFNPPVKHYSVNQGSRNSLSNGIISTIIPDGKGKLWIGTRDGLNIFDPETEAFEVLRAKDLPGIRGTVIVPMLVDRIRQKAWLNAGYDEQGNEMDLYEMDIPSRKCRLVYFRDKPKQLIRSNLLYAHFHPYKGGLLLWDEARGLFEMKWDSLHADLQVSMKAGVGGWDMQEDRYMYFHGGGEANFTFENMSGKWVKVPHHLDSFFYSSKIYNEKDQTHWVSTKYELIHYTKNFQRIKTYGQEDGFNSLIMNMQPDHAGNIWFANKLNQIGRLDFTTGTISYLSETDGIRNIKFEWFTPVAKDARGDIYFGSGAWVKEDVGLYRVRPEKYLSAPASYVYLRSLKVNQKPFPLTRGINNLEELTLRFNQNTLTIETGIIDYYSKGKGRIRYRLESEGRNEAWQYGPAYSLIRYDGLTPGNYRLVLQSSNAGNEFNGPEKVLSIIIHPPFWATWWFRVLTVLALISGVYAIIQYRSRNLRRRNMELEEKVYHRTIELKHSLEELRETQEQLIHREKMASLGELTAGIAHEIQNPLNFVNNFSDLNAELIHELKEDLDRGNLTEARKVADDIFENEHKINHHGKRADSIVKGMLQHSRVGTGQKEMTDINALVAEYLRISYHGLRAKDKTFHAVAHTDLDERIGKINIIPQDIGRVLLNLYNNAFDAVTERSKLRVSGYEPTVTVTTKQVGAVKGNAGSLPRSDVPDTQFVVISVQDNGKGIPEKIRTKIFQPFFTTKPAGQGTGLGLSLSYDIIKAHGGELRMETTEGEGSVFIIQLPAKEMN